MTDTAVQSFCERCGTRYASAQQESSAERGRPKLGRPFGKRGAHRDPDDALTTTLPTAEAFRETFHFCLDCRQYTCQKCWDDEAGHCLSCGPLPEGSDQSTTGLPFTPLLGSSNKFEGASPRASRDRTHAWPTTDLAGRRRPPATTSGATPDGPTGSPPDAPEADPWTGRPPDAGAPAEVAAVPTVDPWRDVRFSAADRRDGRGTVPPSRSAAGSVRVSDRPDAADDRPASAEPPDDGPAADPEEPAAPYTPGGTHASTEAISAWRERVAFSGEADPDLESDMARPLDRIAWGRDAPRAAQLPWTPSPLGDPASPPSQVAASPPPTVAAPPPPAVPHPPDRASARTAKASPEEGVAVSPEVAGPLPPPSTAPQLPAMDPLGPPTAVPPPASADAAPGTTLAPAPPAAMKASPPSAIMTTRPSASALPPPASAPSLPASAPSLPTPVAAPASRPVIGGGPAAGIPQAGSKARPCRSCGLPLSAQARFCRRCGVPQV